MKTQHVKTQQLKPPHINRVRAPARSSLWLSRLPLVVALLAHSISAAAGEALAAAPGDWRAKVDARLLDGRAPAAPAEFLVVMSAQANLADLAGIEPPKMRRRAIVARLRAVAARTQAPLIAFLDARGAAHQSFFITNMIHVRANAALLTAVAQQPAVARVLANPITRFVPPRQEAPRAARAGVEPNLTVVGAPSVWALGITGAGAVVAGADTGYRFDHDALKNQYRGWDGATANHDYAWHDAIHTSVGICGADSPFPCDDHGHGTHTLGTMIGDDGGANQTGMAPGARWIGCRNMDGGSGTPATYIECFQWFLAPTDSLGANPEPDAAPDVISNSWTCPVSEGCADPAVLQAIVDTVRTAGIFVAAAASNKGPSCGSIAEPLGIYDASVTVAATNNAGVAASFSARGPVTVAGQQRPKPDISAPGVSVRSSHKNGGYTTMSGTSMATPHVAGLVALMISANPALAGQVDVLESLILQTAVPTTTTNGCGGDTPSTVPNHTYGYGRIDAHAAVLAALALAPSVLPALSPHTLLPVVVLLAGSGWRTARRRAHATRT